jgi:hypothetical protein
MIINCILLSHMIVHVWQAYLMWDTCHMLYLDYLTTHTSLSPIRRGFAPGFVNYNKEYTRLAAASDKVYQLLAHGRWFSPASSTTKTGRHDIAEILLKVALNTKNQIKWIICYTHICISHVSFLLNKLIYPKANHLKFIHKIRDHLRKVKFNFKLCNIFHSGMFCSDLW